ncbi:ATPase [Niabella ginsenosidivorans]|uniref:ATPase n=1 Tax=Niabella ginsenosidivorans TaxID=1176587 RepID=A0A1A9I061_9BACT|nr:AAA family ATPase [Niabella ginsenosidivorans]ANH80725.1 ATPase [Niabella ginsenosidivorans]
MIRKRFFVITGGPGAGKTTLLKAMQDKGFHTVPEVSRTIIQQQVLENGDALPWKNKYAYAQLMLAASVASYKSIMETYDRVHRPIIFFDRGIPDTIGYAELVGIQPELTMYEAARNHCYNKTVFILPPWKEIYQKDAERKQDWDEAVATYHQMKTTYEQFGYTTIDVPVGTIDSRVDFLLKTAVKR